MNIFDSIRMAARSIRANKMRSFLTMLGIIIGISSVITIISLGSGGQASITDEFEKIGGNSININVDTSKAQPTDRITLEDIRQIKEQVDSIKYISPVTQMMGSVLSDRSENLAYLIGGSADLFYIDNMEMIDGRFFNEQEYESGAAVAVVEENLGAELFGYSDVVGESITVNVGGFSKKVTIIGVYESSAAIFIGAGEQPLMLTLPVTFINNLRSAESSFSSITVVASSQNETESAGFGAISVLESRHNNREQELYSAQNMMDILDQINSVLGIFTAFISAVAAISLLVGGIGVMNIMLVSVTERTREIGIRKAIGATTRSIMIQFLIEAILITIIGGLIGLLLGVLGAEAIGSFAGISPVVSPAVVVGVILFSSAVGIFFGIYPARKAARLDPIDALRYE